jgi:hypothetical protein
VQLPEKTVDVIKNWNIVNRLIMALEAKMHAVLKKTNGGRTKHISLDAGEDANDAGTDKSDKCILYLVEGKSAAAYPKKRIVMSEGGKDFGGYYPLRGKFLNVRNASILSIAENKEVKSIKAMVGLREGLDYTQAENLATLRYGWIMICVDADSDGFHIASLLINYINQFYLIPGEITFPRNKNDIFAAWKRIEFDDIKDEQQFKQDYKLALDSLPVDTKVSRQIVAEANVAFTLNMKLFQELETSFVRIASRIVMNYFNGFFPKVQKESANVV